MGSKEESTRIAELQQENFDLQTTLEDHQSALELIMSKYREHVSHSLCFKAYCDLFSSKLYIMVCLDLPETTFGPRCDNVWCWKNKITSSRFLCGDR